MGLLPVSCCSPGLRGNSGPCEKASRSPGVSVGEAMAIWCRRQRQGVRFVLNKEGRHFPPVDSDGFGAVFPISNVSREDGGNYSCSYHSRSEPFAVSDPSDPMELVVRGEGYPKPNISGIPRRGVSVGEAMAIWCRRQRQGVRFVLNKEGRHFPPVDSDGFGAVFPISNVSREDGGNYSCSYHSRSEPFAVSDPSDPMELLTGLWIRFVHAMAGFSNSGSGPLREWQGFSMVGSRAVSLHSKTLLCIQHL
uniref:Ig-like domain-containing protein n=1 Tax=Gopherus agassizii TaxID=38772 RepID=A0A452J2A9_9SAUR